MSEIISKESTLQNLVQDGYAFNIPIYQRLYVWKSNQITTLLDDLVNSYDKDEKAYYVGGIMVTKNKLYIDNYRLYDVIDGQQRFTTFWLISSILKGMLDQFRLYSNGDVDNSRILFSVRDFANQYFKDPTLNFTEEEERELLPIREALQTIKAFINENFKHEGRNIEHFTSYIFKKVYFIMTEMPESIDENKIFEAMNNRGVQLQQHEILKSRILRNINKNERGKYALIWDACSQMDKYLEKSIKDVADLSWKQLFSTDKEDEIVKLPEDILKILSTQKPDETEISLRTILGAPIVALDEEDMEALKMDESDDNDYEVAKVRSVIPFPMLLLHTLRIYQFRYKSGEIYSGNSAEVNAKELNEIFEKNYSDYGSIYMISSEDDAKAFIMLLWKVREVFDRFVVKWVTKSEGTSHVEYLEILNLYQNKNSYQRKLTKSYNELALLQSMLYHSQQLITHYWLTPFLNYLLDHEDLNDVLNYLKKLDNEMFCNPRRDLRTMSFELLSKDVTELKGNPSFIEQELNRSLGVSFPHYFFYKLEFILWSERSEIFKNYSLGNQSQEKWEKFRLTARNSLEHIFPQNQKKENSEIVYLTKEEFQQLQNHKDKNYSPIDDFGNLVLLTSSLNSSYGNKSFGEKKEQFLNNNNIDSLKSSLIFSEEKWDWLNAQKHKNNMITLFKDYLAYHNN